MPTEHPGRHCQASCKDFTNTSHMDDMTSFSKSKDMSKVKQRRYGFACSNCRRRKAKCDGALPSCQKCIGAKENCRYDKSPSLHHVVGLEHELRAYRQRFEQLREANAGERDSLLAKPITVEGLTGGKARAPSPSSRDIQGSETSGVGPVSEDEDSPTLEEVLVTVDGSNRFYGKTSLYYGDNDEAAGEGVSPMSRQEASSVWTVPGTLITEQARLATFIAEITPDIKNELLEVYWCWPSHLHCILSKKVFLRDLHTCGQYVTSFLLSAVLAQAARYSTRLDANDLGNYFAKRTLELMMDELDRGSSISTVQGLLIFSSRECACGRTSQGWLYAGMAFRMARDLGIHILPEKLGLLSNRFSDEELALRRQVFWSCYTWDKTISLCLGRPPIIDKTIELPTVEGLLDSPDADQELWHPIGLGGLGSGTTLQGRAWSSTRFIAYCELCTIMHGILDKLYSRPHSSQPYLSEYLTNTLQQLDDWLSNLVPDLVVNLDSGLTLCPPLHILLLNLMFNTAVILLCRPFRRSSMDAKNRCTEVSRLTDMLFTMHVRRFGFRCVTWLQTYTMFVACTINVLDFKEAQAQGDTTVANQASARLEFGCEVLRQATTTPTASRCAGIITQLLEKHAENNEKHKRSSNLNESTSDVQLSNITAHNATETTPNSLNMGSLSAPVPSLPPYSEWKTSSNQRYSGDGPQLETVGNMSQGPVTQDFNPEMDSALGIPAGILPSPSSLDSVPGTEKPSRWLLENVYDDGSWMLSDVDYDAWVH